MWNGHGVMVSTYYKIRHKSLWNNSFKSFQLYLCMYSLNSYLLTYYKLRSLKIYLLTGEKSLSAGMITSRSIRVDSCRFDNIFKPLSLYRRHLCLLQIDFRYAFPCHKRWFLRLPVSHHHWAANRPPVWRFVNCLWRFAAARFGCIGQPSPLDGVF